MLSQAIGTKGEASASGAKLPFSDRVGGAEVLARARRLVEALGLGAGVRVCVGGGAAGLRAERGFRLGWWARGEEPLRAALQRLKAGVMRRAADVREEGRLTGAWVSAERSVNSEAWRAQLRRAVEGSGPEDSAYLRLAFRAAQQAWTRAARWRSLAREGSASPFDALLELYAAGAWPLGCRGGSLHVFVWEKGARVEEDFAQLGEEAAHTSAEQGGTSAGEFVFLSAPFGDPALTSRWQGAMREGGFETVHGPVSEFVSPPEVQLGARIRRARAVVGILAERDDDFGLPWWMFQELDYARACGRPVFLVSRGEALEAENAGDEKGLRGWLEANAVSLWGGA